MRQISRSGTRATYSPFNDLKSLYVYPPNSNSGSLLEFRWLIPRSIEDSAIVLIPPAPPARTEFTFTALNQPENFYAVEQIRRTNHNCMRKP